jgi:diguanylate cyclase (GGDEF)-like protein
MKSLSEPVQRKEKTRRSSDSGQSSGPSGALDPLTGLPDRHTLVERLREAIAGSSQSGEPFAVVCLDLHGLRVINDRHGYDAGDQLLVSAAQALKRTLRKGDLLVRIGGDEFAAVLHDLPSNLPAGESFISVLTRLLDAAAEPVLIGDFPLQLSASIGVAFYPQGNEDDVDAEQLLRQAGQAMLKAMREGKNNYCFFNSALPGALQSAESAHEPLTRIRQALAAGELVLYYQPKVNMATGKVIGAEALIRWLHPERGLISPTEFLPLIENHPLAVAVGEWVIASALEQMENWLQAGLVIPVSVNVSARQLQQDNFLDRLREMLAEHPLVKPFSLELEILETSALADIAQLSKLLASCGAIGVSIALDDFGNGNASLNDLRKLPASVFKIDPSFVLHIVDNQEDVEYLEGVLGLASAFKRQSIAEGVESVDHGLMLLRLGCELGQGYGISPPMKAEEFPGWVAAWKPDPRWARALSVSVDDRLIQDAGDEHRTWVAAIEAFVKGESESAPRQTRHQCRLGAWLDAEGQAGRNSQPAFQALMAAHLRIHALAAGLVKLQAQGKSSEGLTQLHTMLDKLLEALQEFRLKG